MKREARLSLSIASSCLLVLAPALVRARSLKNSPAATGANALAKTTATMTMEKQEARRMVPAQVSLLSDINAQKIHTGHLFRARLSHTVHLKSGQELPGGTVLWGKVTTDTTQADGRPRIALQFIRAVLRNGKTIPIRAAIMGVSPPQYGDLGQLATLSPIAWNGKELQMDEIGAISGVDLHSRIAGASSGVFVATKKDNVKLRKGSQLALAIAQQNKKELHSNSMNSGV